MALSEEQTSWVLAVLELSLSLVFLVIPCWYFLWRWRAEHHRITQACMLLLIPDFLLILNFLPKHIADLSQGTMVLGGYCTASAFQTVASICASNCGNIVVAYVTKRMLDPKDQKVTVPHHRHRGRHWLDHRYRPGLLLLRPRLPGQPQGRVLLHEHRGRG